MVTEFLLENLKREGERLGIPPDKNRALIREYLQSKIIYYLYEESSARKLSFIGGTSLRLLRDLDRFSEDLDFDNLGLNFLTIKKLFLEVKNKLAKEGFEADYKIKKTNGSGIGELKFKNLLYQLKISNDPKENLVIKINYTTPKYKPSTEVSVLSRFGLVQTVITNSKEFLLAQKIRAILKRKDLQPRDFYDVVWFLSHRVKPEIKNDKEVFLKIEKIYSEKVEPNLKHFKKRLAPFLINEKNIYYLDLFKKMIKNLQ